MPPLFLQLIGTSHTGLDDLELSSQVNFYFFISFFHPHIHSAGPHSGFYDPHFKLLSSAEVPSYSVIHVYICSLASRFCFLHLQVISSAEVPSYSACKVISTHYTPEDHSLMGFTPD